MAERLDQRQGDIQPSEFIRQLFGYNLLRPEDVALPYRRRSLSVTKCMRVENMQTASVLIRCLPVNQSSSIRRKIPIRTTCPSKNALQKCRPVRAVVMRATALPPGGSVVSLRQANLALVPVRAKPLPFA
jgi:hypothetical protein